ncbi:hypothetical protein AAVH_28073 [Aphelenchoides avenae]|nr:hypothetical protein AAVH_28073 [Aphelenchus avenae]
MKRTGSPNDTSDDDTRSPRKQSNFSGSHADAVANDLAQNDTFDADAVLGQKDVIIDCDNLSVRDEESLEPLAEGVEYLSFWKSGVNASVMVQVLGIKMDKKVVSFANKEQKIDAYSLLVEDETGKTHICAFDEPAVRLKLAVHDKVGSVIIFKNVLAKQPSDQRFLPGSIPFELRFGNASMVHVMPQSATPITTLCDVVHTLGRRNADFNVLCMTNFKDFTASFGGIPTYRGNVTDGRYETLLQIPFQPHFKAGQELAIKKFMPHVNGNDVFISISSVADAVVVDAGNQKIERKIKISSLIPLKMIKKENAATAVTNQKKNQ